MYKKLKELFYFRNMFLGYYLLKDGRSFLPLQLGISPTARCNLRCKMCAQWGERGHLIGKTINELKSEEMPVGKWKKIIDEARFKRPSVIIWGGEPFLYPEIIELISHVKSRGLRCLVITNGAFLFSCAQDLVRMNLDEIEISIDGPRQVNDEIRGAGAYDKTMDGLGSLLRWRKEARTPYPKITINTVITANSYSTLEEVVELSQKLGVDGVNFIYGWSISSDMGIRYESVCKKVFDIEAISWKGFKKEKIDIDIKKLEDRIASLMRIKRKTNLEIGFLPELSPSKIAGFYSGAAPRKKKCFSLWHRADIRYNGDVVFCGDFPDYILGNAREDSFLSIWNNERARNFRRRIKQMGLLPICSRCCNLYLYNNPF